ncbi:hypothetical protein Mal52_07520 [Symmachiella dynata]|uniref:Uncharacterized protein n=1 Tax=Symmachiella dynata TaxID=2527995 RepID=A0A517ZIJ3_9PLAN|nr:NfeD family protein [Symmachiella dynata]QDU42296.1 hypothetical protein Mal52_07520 [Symmachiella dynata]
MEQMCIDRERRRRAAWLLGAFAAFLPISAALGDADVDQAKPQAAAIGQFITLDGTIDDAAIGRVKRMGLALQNRAQQEGRKGVLVLEITKGTSQFHNVQGLANFLSKDLPGLRKVAWIPQDVSGNNVVAALACNDIVMHPDAALGNIGLGKPLDPDEQNFVVNLVNRRHNNKLSSALAMGMTDPQVEVIQVQIQSGEPPNDATETRLVLPGEFERLQRVERVAIPQHETVKNPGRAGTFTGSQAAHGGYLVSAVAQDKSDVAELYGLPRQAMREDPAGGDAPIVRVIRIDDVIESVLQGFVVRHVEQAVAEGANLIIFEIDSPGGVLLAGQEIAHTIADLDSQKVRTIAYIPHEAISAAALISLGCDEIYMHPDAKIGDIGVIAQQGPNAEFQFIPEKLLTVLKEDAKDLARKKNRPEALALSMIIKETEVYQVKHRDTGRVWYMTEDEIHAKGDEWIKGAIVPETRNNMFLTISGERAEELLIAEAPVADQEELRERLSIPPEVSLQAVGRTWVDSLVFVLNEPGVKLLLIVLGIIGVYIELHVPSGLFGIGAGVCFALFFWASYLGGTAGWLEVVLFLCGIICIGIELFVIPGLTVFGVSGGLLMIASLILASQTFVIPQSSMDYKILERSVISLAGAIVGVVVIAAVLNRFLPKMPLFDQLVLTPPGAEHAGQPQLAPDLVGAGTARLVGRTGVATTVLRPAGKAKIDDDLIDVVSDGPFIDAGSDIEVVSAEGNYIIVRRV